MSRINWTQSARQLDNSSGLWYKFGQDGDGNWHILSSGDRDSLEQNTVVYHDHYWQRNGHWYFQGRRGDRHIIGRDDLIEGIRRQNQTNSLNLTDAEKQEINLAAGSTGQLTSQQIKKLADYRARQAYGHAGYAGNTHGVEMPPDESQICDRLIVQHQSTTNRLNWRDANDETAPLNELSQNQLKWRDTTSENPNPVPQENRQLKSDRLNIKPNRKTTR